MNVELVRHAYLPKYTLGTLKTPEFSLATIERPWIKNLKGPGGVIRQSCVEDGTYQLVRHESEKFPNTFALKNPELGVWHYAKPPGTFDWGRTAILIHQGNWVRDVVGCIAVGIRHGRLNNEEAVINSEEAMDQLREILSDGVHRITIRPTYGTRE